MPYVLRNPAAYTLQPPPTTFAAPGFAGFEYVIAAPELGQLTIAPENGLSAMPPSSGPRDAAVGRAADADEELARREEGDCVRSVAVVGDGEPGDDVLDVIVEAAARPGQREALHLAVRPALREGREVFVLQPEVRRRREVQTQVVGARVESDPGDRAREGRRGRRAARCPSSTTW